MLDLPNPVARRAASAFADFVQGSPYVALLWTFKAPLLFLPAAGLLGSFGPVVPISGGPWPVQPTNRLKAA